LGARGARNDRRDGLRVLTERIRQDFPMGDAVFRGLGYLETSMRVRLAVVLAALAACAVASPAQAGLGLNLVAGGFDQPVDVASTPSQPNRVYVVEQTGRVKIVQNGAVLAKNFLDL